MAKRAGLEEGTGPLGTGSVHRAEKLSEMVARSIAKDISTQKLTPGSKLPSEAVMLDRYRMGRASLREGLRILEIQGLITIKPGPGGGPMVAEAGSEDFGRMSSLHYQAVGATFRELLQARIVIEPLMAGIAAEQKHPEVVARLLDIASHTGPRDLGDFDLGVNDFHAVLAGASDNPVLNLFGQSLRDVYAAHVSSSLLESERRSIVVAQHMQIAKAISNGEATKARRLTREHMEDTMNTVAALYPGLLDEVVAWH